MIRETQVSGAKHKNIRFKEHKLAHELLDGLTGLEIGASAHNGFGLAGSLNVSPGDDLDVYRKSEIDLCGHYAEIDITAEGDNLPVANNSQGYVISSHAFEHFPDPLKALREWIRVVRDGGIIFMIVPHRDALESDAKRPLTTADDWMWASGGVTVDTWNELRPHDPVHRRGHYGVYSHDSLKELIEYFWHEVDARQPWLEYIASEPVDSKVSNGHTHVLRVHKPAAGKLTIDGVEIPVMSATWSAIRGQGELIDVISDDGDLAEPIRDEQAEALPDAETVKLDGEALRASADSLAAKKKPRKSTKK